MSDFENPYQSPESQVIPEASQSSGMLSAAMLQYLNEASPWLRFVGIMGYIGSGSIVLMGIGLGITMAVASNLAGAFGQFPVWLAAVLYIPMGVLLFFPAHFTYNFGKKIRSYRFTNSIEDLELAFKNNKSLWKFNGIIYIIYLAFIPLVIIIAIVAGVAAALNM